MRIAHTATLAAALLTFSSCAHSPDRDPSPAPSLPGHLVNIRNVDPTIAVDLRYSTSDNITGKPLYPPTMPCLVHADTAEKLKHANAYLADHGFRLKIWDAWRPPEVHQKLFDAVPNGTFVAEPSKDWSRHCYGAAVDVTLVDKKGREQPMPSKFDDFQEKSGFLYTGDDETIHHNVTLLQRAMVSAGFKVFIYEWWHFNDLKAEDIQLVRAADLNLTLPQ